MPWVRADKRRHVVKLNVTKKDFEGLVQSLSVLVIDVQDRTISKRLAASGNHFAHLLSGFAEGGHARPFKLDRGGLRQRR